MLTASQVDVCPLRKQEPDMSLMEEAQQSVG